MSVIPAEKTLPEALLMPSDPPRGGPPLMGVERPPRKRPLIAADPSWAGISPLIPREQEPQPLI